MTLEFILLILLGLALLFAGLPLFRILLVGAAAWAGFNFGPEFLLMLTGQPPGVAAAWISAAVLGVLLVLVSWFVFRLAFFTGGALIGYALTVAVTGNPLAGLAAGLVAGLISAVAGRAALIILTSLSGAWLLLAAVLLLLGTAPAGGLPLWFLPATLVLAAAGMAAQFRSGSSAQGSW
jgi:hypothetical protein